MEQRLWPDSLQEMVYRKAGRPVEGMGTWQVRVWRAWYLAGEGVEGMGTWQVRVGRAWGPGR